MRLIDVDAIRLPKGFFEKVNNVPKFYEWLSEQPTIDLVKHGRWVDATKEIGWPVWKCSVCGGNGRGDYLVCPWCGAKMKRDWMKINEENKENEEMSKVSEMEMAYAEFLND